MVPSRERWGLRLQEVEESGCGFGEKRSMRRRWWGVFRKDKWRSETSELFFGRQELKVD